ncbi:hypothetical protein EVAR_65448_1 [Eumeta japonica]|uniref:Uncharacterized protein n=1 Tax=Eumeta variegata TaxID=151549 RepID=A0A4C1ZEQ1_EUMVA|nr:hypothetical protein EVAR_65448_1 [Eumeta japonica]
MIRRTTAHSNQRVRTLNVGLATPLGSLGEDDNAGRSFSQNAKSRDAPIHSVQLLCCNCNPAIICTTLGRREWGGYESPHEEEKQIIESAVNVFLSPSLAG